MLKRRSWLGLALAVPFLPGVVRAQGGGMVVFAAASLKNALDEIAGSWSQETGKRRPGSPMPRARRWPSRSKQGAPADLFISADLDWMDYVGRQEPDQGRTRGPTCSATDRADRAQRTRRTRRSTSTRASTSPARWAAAGWRWPMSTPCRPASTARRRWRSSACGISVADSVAQAENVRAALALVSRGEAPLGIVYRPMPRPIPA